MAKIKALLVLFLLAFCPQRYLVGNCLGDTNDPMKKEPPSLVSDTTGALSHAIKPDSNNISQEDSKHIQRSVDTKRPIDREEAKDFIPLFAWITIVLLILFLSQLALLGFGYHFVITLRQETVRALVTTSERLEHLRTSSVEQLSRANTQLAEIRTSLRVALENISEGTAQLPEAVAMKFIEIWKKHEQEHRDSITTQKKNEIKLLLSERLKELGALASVRISKAIWPLASRHLIPEESVGDYSEVGRQLELIDSEISALLENPQPTETQLTQQYWVEKVDVIAKRAKRLPSEPSQDIIVSVIDRIWNDPNLQNERDEILSLLNLRLVIPPTKQYLAKPELDYIKVVGSRGAGKRMYVKEVVAPGIQRVGTVNWIQNPKVIVDNV
jgi:hypothetical protein